MYIRRYRHLPNHRIAEQNSFASNRITLHSDSCEQVPERASPTLRLGLGTDRSCLLNKVGAIRTLASALTQHLLSQ